MRKSSYKDCEIMRLLKAKLIHNALEFLTKNKNGNIFHTNYNKLIFSVLKLIKRCKLP